MSPGPIDRSDDLRRLRDEGYDLEIRNGHLLVHDVPYVDASGSVRRGTLVSTLRLGGDVTVAPDTHVAMFIGDQPCDAEGAVIEAIRHSSNPTTIAPDLTANHSFSSKPPSGHYADYYEKMTAYVNILQGPAQALDADATAKTFPPIPTEESDSVFWYVDTATSRAGTNAAAAKIAGLKIAIVGIGGTGSYVLDLVAKTPVAEIHLFDGDTFCQHNAFRAPGAAPIDDLRLAPNKAEYFTEVYSRLHRHIIPHGGHVSEANINEVLATDFVFLCLEGGPAKRFIIDQMLAEGTPFVDVGMGVEVEGDQLIGIVRVTTVTEDKSDHIERDIHFGAGPPGEYESDVQVADLNCFNASLAVIKWKKLFGFYADMEREHQCLYTIDGNQLTNEEQS